jgi:aspartate carbamoyltransferase catalytic subunit
VVNVKGSGSSVEKGESLKDTVLTLDAYAPDVLVIRHPAVGAAKLATGYTGAAVINAGDGAHAHPTQALLDIYTVEREVGPIDGLHVAFVGDVLHSRVARSGALAFRLMGAHVSLIGPATLMPRDAEDALDATVGYDIADIAEADLVYVLRMQRERMGAGGHVPTLREYAAMYGVNHGRLRPGQRVMHAGPMNRGVEISPALADDPVALVERQARYGMVVRMAVLHDVIAQSGEDATDSPPLARVQEV